MVRRGEIGLSPLWHRLKQKIAFLPRQLFKFIILGGGRVGMSTVTAGVQNKVTLKLFNEENITDEYLNWFKDKGFTRYLESKDITKQQALEHYRQCKTDGSFFTQYTTATM